MNALTKAWLGVKAALVRFSTRPGWSSWWGSGAEYDFERAVPEGGRHNSIVAACVKWLARTFPEAPLVVRERTSATEWSDRPDHRLQDVLDRPNPFYSGLELWSATLADWVFGDAYWIKIRGADRRVRELWWMPSWMMEPKWEGTDFISYYEQNVDGQIIRWPIADVIHFRNDRDPRNPRKGLGLKALIREVATDQEASGWTVAMVRNVNPPGIILSPAGDQFIPEGEPERIKATFSARFGGEHRGEPLVMGGPTKVDVLSYSPEQMKLTEIRRVPEERITAYLGIPAIVVGLGAGLDRATYSNYDQARQAAYDSCLIPTQRLFAATLNAQLTPEFGDPKRLRLEFDLQQVRVLQDDEDATHARARDDLLAGGISVNEYRQMIGQEPLVGPEGDLHFVPNTVTLTPPDRLIPPEQPAITDVTPPADDEASPAPRALAAAGATNGYHKAADGLLSEEDLDRLSTVGPEDVPGADRFWRRVVDDDLADLLDARPEDE